ncbi:hypothetical protein CY35_03G039400 [Sphagnum magellanicum]|nr:hypothetical protein CY35_03G039400 [Sphagnum magellanicum]
MFAKLVLTDEEKAVDEELGYPHGYAKLCRHAAAQLQGLLTPFTEGPPQRFLPYAPQTEDFVKLKEWDSLFPVVAEGDRDPPNARKHAEELWLQLDHLGNAGFDPAKFRVDAYGNVVYWNADPSSPLAWEVDHWYPHSRGGKTVVSNLRIVQWQANQRKKNRLEFLVPWWDLQHGVSINQFLSAFASKNADFRRRSFALFFAGGEDEKVAREHVGECRPWPQEFREKKALFGLAAAAIVSPMTDNNDIVKIGHISRAVFASSDMVTTTASGTPARRRWSAEEEDALRRALQRFGPGCWKEIKENEPALANRSTVQIKDKFRLMRGDWQIGKENIAISTAPNGQSEHGNRQSAATVNLQKELRVKILREEEKREKQEDVAKLEETVITLRQQNEKERLALLDIEDVLRKHKQRVEKQRRWAETQSSYRLCLERMIRDTMHQSLAYKEQARLNQAACNALMARLDCQKAICDAAEKDLIQRHAHREALSATGGTAMMEIGCMSGLRGKDIVDVSSCVSLFETNEEHEGEEVTEPDNDRDCWNDGEDEKANEVHKLQMQLCQSQALHQQLQQQIEQEYLNNYLVEDGLGQRGRPKEAVNASELTLYLDATAQDQEEEWVRLPESQDGCKGMEEETDFAKDENMSCKFHGVQDVAVMQQGIETEIYGVDPKGEQSFGDTEDALNVLPDKYGDDPPASEAVAEELLVLLLKESRPDYRQEHQKNVIVEQSQSNAVAKEVRVHWGPRETYKHTGAHLLEQVRLQMQMAGVSDGRVNDGQPIGEQQEQFDELLQQVLTTHVDRGQRNEAAAQQTPDFDDEEKWQIGKSNLDKWLQALLQKDGDSAGSSPANESPLLSVVSPVLSTARAAMCGNMDLEVGQDQDSLKRVGESMDKPKGLWGGLVRKLSVKQQTELSRELQEESDEEPIGVETKNTDENLTHVLNSLKNIMLNEEDDAKIVKPKPFESRHAVKGGGDEADQLLQSATKPFPETELTELHAEDSVAGCVLDTHLHSTERNSTIETDTESLSSTNPDSQSMEGKDMLRMGLRSSFKAATIAWRKAVKKLETKLQEGLSAYPPLD